MAKKSKQELHDNIGIDYDIDADKFDIIIDLLKKIEENTRT